MDTTGPRYAALTSTPVMPTAFNAGMVAGLAVDRLKNPFPKSSDDARRFAVGHAHGKKLRRGSKADISE